MIEGTNPAQYRTKFLDLVEEIFPPIIESYLASDNRIAYCAAVDRNGYMPVHGKFCSLPQRPGDLAWNTANCRNRRIFDDRAGLASTRNVRPYLIQSNPRDMGKGVIMMTRDIAAPIQIFRAHWGAFRTGYRL